MRTTRRPPVERHRRAPVRLAAERLGPPLGDALEVGPVGNDEGGGYFDQAHLSRDFAELAGCTPSQLLADELPSFQDDRSTEV